MSSEFQNLTELIGVDQDIMSVILKIFIFVGDDDWCGNSDWE